ncbi:MAG: hypothetical protein C0596_04355 [Marinilabiliales bacterium]|nr:MAG: hypothetical protein C0596_04355 [Marinilabiliales bacterium]
MQKAVVISMFILINILSYGQKDSDCILDNTIIYEENDSTFLSDAYSRYRFFIMCEYHFREENTDLFLKVFKNLYTNANVRIVFMESGYANGYLVNHYLQTGDEECLSFITDLNQFEEKMYKELKKFYDTLPEDEKFKFVGVDVEIYEADYKMFYTVSQMIQDSIMPEKLEDMIFDFQEKATEGNTDAAQDKFDDIYFDWKNNKESYKELMGNNYDSYETLMKRMKKSYRFQFYNYNYGRDTLKQTQRERYIYNNISSVVKENTNCNFFAQFGLAHIGLERFLIAGENNGFQSFSANLNTNKKSPLKDSVCSIAILYFDEVEDYGSKLFLYYSDFTYFLSRKKYLPNEIYKTLKKNTIKNKTYLVNVSKNCNSSMQKANKNFQYLIFTR